MSLIVLVSGFLRGLTGFGFAIAATPLLSTLVSPAQAVPLVLLLQLAFGLIDARSAWREAHRTPFKALVVGVVVGTPVGMVLLRALPLSIDRLIVAGAAALSLASVLLSDRRFIDRLTASAPVVGLLSGVLNGLAAMPGPPVSAHFLNAPITAASARASLIVFFTITALVGAVTSLALGLMTPQALVSALICTPCLVAGNWAGTQLFRRGDERLFRAVAISALSISVAAAAWRGLSGFR